MGFDAPLAGEILRLDGGEWVSEGVVEQHPAGFRVVDRRVVSRETESIPLDVVPRETPDEISKHFEIATRTRPRFFPRPGGPDTPPCPLPSPRDAG